MKFTILQRDGTTRIAEAPSWKEIVEKIELEIGRENLKGIIWQFKNNYFNTPEEIAVRKIAQERVNTEYLIQAFAEEAKTELSLQKALSNIKEGING